MALPMRAAAAPNPMDACILKNEKGKRPRVPNRRASLHKQRQHRSGPAWPASFR
jgi:hypothetical protein